LTSSTSTLLVLLVVVALLAAAALLPPLNLDALSEPVAGRGAVSGTWCVPDGAAARQRDA
jgi:hypothetical protein